jgi:hypothetical protein
MSGTTKWIAQFLLAACSMFGLLIVIELLVGGSFADAWLSSLIWAVAASAIFIVSRYNRARSSRGHSLADKLSGKK